MLFKKTGGTKVMMHERGAHDHDDIEMPPNGVVSDVNSPMLEAKRHVREPLNVPGWRKAAAVTLNFTGLAVAAISILLLVRILINDAEATLGDIISIWVLTFTSVAGGALSGVGADMNSQPVATKEL